MNSLSSAALANSNRAAWRDGAIVAEYARAAELQPPEAAILARLKGCLAAMNMLDIGVGGGRTLRHFAPLARDYWGIDYSAAMIAACQARLPARLRNVTLAVCDARSMTIFPRSCFDFVLFSYNGIDYVAHEDRLRIFAEVKRVGRRGGWFGFSSHNLEILQSPSGHGRTLLRSPYAIVNDGVHQNRLLTYYIKPAEQLKQLRSFFGNVEIYRLSDGQAVQSQPKLRLNGEPWVYYLCQFT